MVLQWISLVVVGGGGGSCAQLVGHFAISVCSFGGSSPIARRRVSRRSIILALNPVKLRTLTMCDLRDCSLQPLFCFFDFWYNMNKFLRFKKSWCVAVTCSVSPEERSSVQYPQIWQLGLIISPLKFPL